MPRVGLVFEIQADTSPGECVFVLGDRPALGDWRPLRGRTQLSANSLSYPRWTLLRPLWVEYTEDAGRTMTVSYKYAVSNGGGLESLSWERGAGNRQLVVPLEPDALWLVTDARFGERSPAAVAPTTVAEVKARSAAFMPDWVALPEVTRTHPDTFSLTPHVRCVDLDDDSEDGLFDIEREFGALSKSRLGAGAPAPLARIQDCQFDIEREFGALSTGALPEMDTPRFGGAVFLAEPEIAPCAPSAASSSSSHGFVPQDAAVDVETDVAVHDDDGAAADDDADDADHDDAAGSGADDDVADAAAPEEQDGEHFDIELVDHADEEEEHGCSNSGVPTTDDDGATADTEPEPTRVPPELYDDVLSQVAALKAENQEHACSDSGALATDDGGATVGTEPGPTRVTRVPRELYEDVVGQAAALRAENEELRERLRLLKELRAAREALAPAAPEPAMDVPPAAPAASAPAASAPAWVGTRPPTIAAWTEAEPSELLKVLERRRRMVESKAVHFTFEAPQLPIRHAGGVLAPAVRPRGGAPRLGVC